MLKHERPSLANYGNLSRRRTLQMLHEVFPEERPETIIHLYDKYGSENLLVDRLVRVAFMEMERANWAQERIRGDMRKLGVVRSLLFDLYKTTKIEVIKEALDQFTSHREMLCELLKTDSPLSTADREYLLELLENPAVDPILSQTSKRKSTPNQ